MPIAPSKSLAAESGRFKSWTPDLGPWAYDKEHLTHKKIVKHAKELVTRSALNECSLLEEWERKQQLQDALIVAASRYADKGNAVYKAFSPPSGKIMSTCKKFARALVQSGYTLHPSVWSDDPEPEHQVNLVNDLIDKSVFLPKYILGKPEGGSEGEGLGIRYPFKHEVVWNVVLNTVLELELQPLLEDLDNLFCTATVAVRCALLERLMKKWQHIDFTVSDSKPMYNKLRKYIREDIIRDDVLSNRWSEYKERTTTRLRSLRPSNTSKSS